MNNNLIKQDFSEISKNIKNNLSIIEKALKPLNNNVNELKRNMKY